MPDSDLLPSAHEPNIIPWRSGGSKKARLFAAQSGMVKKRHCPKNCAITADPDDGGGIAQKASEREKILT